MTARPSPAQFSSPTPPRDLETWCGGVAFLEPDFAQQALYVEIMKDEDPDPEDFGPMIDAYLLLKSTTETASVTIDHLLSTLSSKFPVLAHRINAYQPSTAILEDKSVKEWFVKAVGVNAAGAARFKYTIAKIAHGMAVPQASIKKGKVSYNAVNRAAKTTCDALGQWLRQNFHEDEDLEGEAPATEPMDVDAHLSDNPVGSDTGASALAPSVTSGSTMLSKRTAEDESEPELKQQLNKRVRRTLKAPVNLQPQTRGQAASRRSTRTKGAPGTKGKERAQTPEMLDQERTGQSHRRSRWPKVVEDDDYDEDIVIIPRPSERKETGETLQPGKKAKATTVAAKQAVKTGPPVGKPRERQPIPGPSMAWNKRTLGPSTTPLQPSTSTPKARPFVEVPASQSPHLWKFKAEHRQRISNMEYSEATLKELSSRRAGLLHNLHTTINSSSV